jgi:hypothetical protein
MPAQRPRLVLAAVVAGLVALPGCGTDDAVRRDVDRGAGTVDERAKDAAKDAGREVENGVEDVDGR